MLERLKEHPVAALLAVLTHLFLLAFFVVKFDLLDRDLTGGNVIETVEADLIVSPQQLRQMQQKLKQEQVAEFTRIAEHYLPAAD